MGAFRAIFALAFLLSSPLAGGAEWEVWRNCRLEADDSNDGDSFHIRAGKGEFILRLYLVDTPETDEGFPERVAEQARYFGITPAQAMQLGELAQSFMEEKLARPFTVHTARHTAMGRSSKPRFYAYVETDQGDLGELLIANGLARVHGVGAAGDSGRSGKSERQKLRRLELEARKQKVGGWGAATGRLNARLPGKGEKGFDAFDAFFHPERVVTQTPSPQAVPLARARTSTPPVPAPTETGAKLDPNTATLEELIKLKGIGPVLASRIIEARPFQSADELRKVRGIGPKKYAELRPHFEPSR